MCQRCCTLFEGKNTAAKPSIYTSTHCMREPDNAYKSGVMGSSPSCSHCSTLRPRLQTYTGQVEILAHVISLVHDCPAGEYILQWMSPTKPHVA